MAELAESGYLPFARERVFALVADIERYPDFVPGYRASRILGQRERRLQVEQVVGLGGLQFRFRSQAELDPPQAIRVHSADFPFRELAIGWVFEPAGEGCRVTFRLTYRLLVPGFTRPTGFLLRSAASETLRAFQERAGQVYGDPIA